MKDDDRWRKSWGVLVMYGWTFVIVELRRKITELMEFSICWLVIMYHKIMYCNSRCPCLWPSEERSVWSCSPGTCINSMSSDSKPHRQSKIWVDFQQGGRETGHATVPDQVTLHQTWSFSLVFMIWKYIEYLHLVKLKKRSYYKEVLS